MNNPRRVTTRITLGAAPKTFRHAIEIEMLDGAVGAITVTYLYRTRSQYGQLIDEMSSAAPPLVPQVPQVQPAPDTPPAADAPETSAPASVRGQVETAIRDMQADYIGRICTGWDIEGVAFDRESIRQLCDEFPAVAARIIGDYGRALTEGRLGN